MAFCTNCGTSLDESAKFCTVCGAKVADEVSPQAPPEIQGAGSAASAPTPAPAQRITPVQPVAAGTGGGALKIILIVLVVIVALGLILTVAGILGVRHFVRNVHVQQQGERARVEMPGMTVTSNDDAVKVARDLGVEVYPGARPLKGASAVTLGNLTVGTAQFETSDPIDRVEQFYRARFPHSNINTSDENSRVILATTNRGMINIVLERKGSTTNINISRTGGHGTRGGGEPQ